MMIKCMDSSRISFNKVNKLGRDSSHVQSVLASRHLLAASMHRLSVAATPTCHLYSRVNVQHVSMSRTSDVMGIHRSTAVVAFIQGTAKSELQSQQDALVTKT